MAILFCVEKRLFFPEELWYNKKKNTQERLL